MTAWDEAAERMDAGLPGLMSKTLDAPAPSFPNNDPGETVRSLWALVCFHQAHYAGQTGILRRVAGKAGAISRLGAAGHGRIGGQHDHRDGSNRAHRKEDH